MKALIGVVTFGLVAAVLTGCEGNWQAGGSAQNFNESGDWQNVSGTYTGPTGSYLVSDYSTLGPTNATGQTVSETVGTTVAGQTVYSGGVSSAPLKAGSFDVAIIGVAAGSDNSAGSISGTGISSGSIDYTTGAWSLTLSAAPPADGAIVATYQTATSAATSGPGSSGVVIHTFTVQQSGNQLLVTDNNGSVYRGAIGVTSGGGSNATTVAYGYDINGVSAAGKNVEMVGVFSVVSNTTAKMTGTWLEQGGKTGHIDGRR